jgi:EAL domain-containing protein (putative c-di-GMP-specific phosphodiesterase class I)
MLAGDRRQDTGGINTRHETGGFFFPDVFGAFRGWNMIHLHGTQAVAFRVLIVEEEPVGNEIIARCIEMLGWVADRAGGPDEAATKFSARPHNVVILGLCRHEEDTARLLRQLRSGHADPTIIFVTQDDGPEVGPRWGHHWGPDWSPRRSTARSGAAALASQLGLRIAGSLVKPIDPYRLHALLLSSPTRRRGDQRRSTPTPSTGDLERALREGEIHTEYQPKIDLMTGDIVGVEALARWYSPTLGMVPPAQFVPVAEQSGLINRLTFRVLTDATNACRRWREVQPNCEVAVNLSPYVLTDPRLLPNVDAILGDSRLPPCALIAEIAEGALLSNLPAATEVLTQLSINGIRVSIDDFGTGYSSILSLMRLPFTELKIDRSFISVCRTDREAWKLVRATVSLARELGMRVVAEGVETEDISDQLRDAGCDTGQGWYFGRPMQDAAMLRWLTPSASRLKMRQATLGPIPSEASHAALAFQS